MERTVYGGNLRRGLSTSCGCRKRELVSAKWKAGDRPQHRTHALSGTPEHVAWKQMKGRCYNPRNPRWSYYGGRGIQVCDRWRDDFAAFLADMGPKPTPKHSLDRIDNDGPYSPENCRWADHATQASNTRRNRIVTYRGQPMTVSQVAHTEGLPVSYLFRVHVDRGLPIEQAVAEVRAGRSR